MKKDHKVWHTMSAAQVLGKLKSSEQGLSSEEAKKRLAKYGPNVLAQEKRFSRGRLLLEQFKSVLIYVLVIAGVISFVFGEFVDAYVIFAAVLLNVIVGFSQEFKANKALEQLSKIVKQESLVFRDGSEQKLESRLLVLGDVVVLQAGDRVPADGRLLDVNDLKVNEASLTGESWPVKKQIANLKIGTTLAERANLVFMGTLVVEGRALAVITETGFETEMGQITVLISETKEERTPLQKKIDDSAKIITKVILSSIFLLFLIGILQGRYWAEMFTIAVALMVAAIPESLIISMTMILTVGMQRILKKNGLVRRLVSAETLGAADLICTDKTGTLTEGEMRITGIVSASHQLDLSVRSLRDIKIDKEIERSMQIALLANDAAIENPQEEKHLWSIIGSPTEKALLLFGAYLPFEELFKKHQRLEEIPFDSSRKFMVSRHKFSAKEDIIFIKGAPEKILSFSNRYLDGDKEKKLTDAKFKYFDEGWQNLSKQGLRVLAGAYRLVPANFKDFHKLKEKPEDFVFSSIWGLSDPLRPETRETLQDTLKAGINTIIITGDNKFTAKKIARDLGLDFGDESVVTGDELLKWSDEEFDKKIKHIKVYARVTPADKLRIVRAWQNKGAIVSMSGDGVNDAPALKAADIGVAVASGSDAAKETADLVLLDNNFKTIVMAIKQGRVIFANIKKVILYLLSNSFAEIVTVAGSLIFNLPLPILAAQVLWINLISDSPPSLALSMEPEEKDIMNKPPKTKEGLLDVESRFLMVFISAISGISALWVFWYFWTTTGNLELAQTVTFATLSSYTLTYIFSIKKLDACILRYNPFKNKYLNWAIILGITLQMIAIYLPFFNRVLRTEPLSWQQWRVILLFVILVLILVEVVKAVFSYYFRKKRR
ncbi:MAG: HAD-IC family P-type ATPase [Patescibacteria group bacterium]|nr:HAD-IC family P-type ATPase [Patescibacteria group bacterium]